MNKTAAALALVVITQCTLYQPTAGGGTETSNGATVAVARSRIRVTAPAGARAMVCAETYNPLFDSGYSEWLIIADSVDSSEELCAGRYNAYIWSTDQRASAQVRELAPHADTVIAVALASPGAITGSIVYAVDQPSDSIFVYLPGSPFAEKARYSTFRIAGVPPGTYTGKITSIDRNGNVYYSDYFKKADGLSVHDIRVSPAKSLDLDSIYVK
jgi:hypothetical protein